MFLLHLLQDDRHKSSETTEHHVWSYSQDFLHSISRRSFMTAKHPLLASTIHTMTGQSTPINILSQLGNYSSYTILRKIETRQAELSQHLAASNKPLPVQAISPENSVLIHFWWDNCDCEKENLQGSVHTTHGVAFQGISSGTTMETNGTEITPSGKRTLTPATSCIHPVTVNQKMPPNRSMIVKWTKTFSAMMSF